MNRSDDRRTPMPIKKHIIVIEIDHTPTVPEPVTFDEAMAAMDAAHDRKDHREHFILFATHGNDVFGHAYIGYWAQGWFVAPGTFAVWERIDQPAHSADALVAMSRAQLRQDQKPGWHTLNRESAGMAYDLACRRWGVDWYGKADGTQYDVALQLALLGEVRYG